MESKSGKECETQSKILSPLFKHTLFSITVTVIVLQMFHLVWLELLHIYLMVIQFWIVVIELKKYKTAPYWKEIRTGLESDLN